MRSDDTVETIKRHVEYEKGTPQVANEIDQACDFAMPFLTRWHINIMHHSQVRC